MVEGVELASGGLAFLGLETAQAWILFALRVVLALFAALLGWYVARPVASVLFRLAFHRPLPPKGLFGSRLVGAVALGALAFYLFPLGIGSGGGTGGGEGQGKGGGKPGKDGPDAVVKGDKPGDDKSKGREALRVEMILSSRYNKDQRWYLIEGKDPPRTLAEVDAYLKQHGDRYYELQIIVYSNAVELGADPIEELKQLANSKYKLRSHVPDEYLKKKKAEGP